ncbi:22002_t:CDS:2, partial [Gigaspora margarita]
MKKQSNYWLGEPRKDRPKEPRRDIICFRCGGIGHIAWNFLSEKNPKRNSEEHQSTNYMGWADLYDNCQEAWNETENTLGEKRPQPYPSNNRESELPQTNMGGEPDLMEEVDEHMDVGSDNSDTFDEFTYEEEMLNEINGYHTEESATEDIEL